MTKLPAELVPILSSKKVVALCSNHFGIGADGLLVLEEREEETAALPSTVHMFNPDGSPMGMCGNGIRCVSGYYDTYVGAVSVKSFVVEGRTITVSKESPADKNESAMFAVDMGSASAVRPMEFLLDQKQALGYFVEVPNPHVVIPVMMLPSQADLMRFGKQIEHDPRFPNRTNVEFVVIRSPTEVELVVWERGAGITLACGTGACAAAVVLHELKKTEASTTISLPGGNLSISLTRNSDKTQIRMTGPAREVFTGEYTWH